MKYYSVTHQGKVRNNNEDALILGTSFCGVADGMGGAQGGEVASGEASRIMTDFLTGQYPTELNIIRAFHKANRHIYQMASENPDLAGMGTTATVLWEMPYEMLLGHVGDSRCYLFREGVLTQMSSDHAMVAELIRNGSITKEEALNSPFRHMITRAIGTEEALEVDTRFITKQPGDVYLLCSDGLCGYVPDEKIEDVLKNHTGDEAVQALLTLALDAGGKDNITIVLVCSEEEKA